MSEIELKFQVPEAAREGLRRAVATASARTLSLRARYADTADGRLAAAGFALRLREEDARRVQTLKGRGAGLIERFEHEVELAPGTEPAAIDPARHAGTPAGEVLAALLADGAPLVEVYRTDIRRLTRRVRSGGATIELALDEGRITAAGRALDVFEIEFELVAGPPAALVALAMRWAERHGLWLDIRPKSERGQRLALGVERVAPVKAAALAWPSPATPAAVFAAALQSALAQVLPNAAEIADESADESAEAEHLHQLRVGLRRLRTVLRLFGPWSGDPPAARDLEQAWREPFASLGGARDSDVLAALPGLPLLPPAPKAAQVDAGEIVRGAVFTALTLRSLGLALAALPALEEPLAELAPPLLRRAWKRIVAGGAAFADATPEARHLLRKRLKRLRYASEFLQPMLPEKPARAALEAMRVALDALGEYNDLVVAETRCRALGESDPKVAFALGWLAANRERLEARAAGRLARLADVPRFWRD